MDRISSTLNDEIIETSPNCKSNLSTTHGSFINEPKRKGNEDRKTSYMNNFEMDRTCLRPLNTDDIISKELPSEILDTDFAGKDEDDCSPEQTQQINISDSDDFKQHRGNEDTHLYRPREDSSDERFKADIQEQDTGYSSDAAENVKSAGTEKNIEPTETKIEEKIERSTPENVEPEIAVVHLETTKKSIDLNGDDQASLPSEEKCVNSNNDSFVPTIIGFRGACSSLISNETSSSNSEEIVSQPTSTNLTLQQINIVNVQGSCEKLARSPEEKLDRADDDVIVLDDCTNADNDDPMPSYSADMDIKQEPPENTENDDNIYQNTQHSETCFTSEIFIEEEKSNNDENAEEEVICIESSGKIPLPIPIKTEALVDSEEKLKTKKLQSPSKESKIASRPVVRDTPMFLTVGYSCHLCNMTFQEHDLLNDHMTLHRNNLVDAKSINKMKQKTMKHACPICKRQLSTLQSLQQHVLIHNDEKPYVCKICGRDFRHQSNYRMHLQKHEAEKMPAKPKIERNIAPAPAPGSRSIDLGKLIGPFYAKDTYMNLGTKTNSRRNLLPAPSSFRCDKVKENLNVLHRPFTYKSRVGELITRTRAVADHDDDVVPLKTFSKVENIIMNAARFIVKVDSIDPNVLKKRIKTPDISIDRNSISPACRRIGEKRKIVLSPPDNNKRLKLDQIENIIMDEDIGSDQQTQADSVYKDGDQDYDNDFGHDDESVNGDSDTPVSVKNVDEHSETSTNTEPFKSVYDSRGFSNKIRTHNDYVSELRRNAQMILKNEAEKSKNLRSSKSSNVIMLKCLPSLKRVPSPTLSHQNQLMSLSASDTPYESSDNSDDEVSANDPFDTAFQRVALRRLLLIQNRAAKNNGKIESKYLLGPRFWRKALRRAKLNPVDFDATKFPDSVPPPPSKPADFDDADKVDERTTNDPKLLQIRAENKLSCMLDKARSTDNTNNVNLIGPLFWKRTLQLAGIHYPRDLSSLLNKERLCLQDIEFVDEVLSVAERKKKPPEMNTPNFSPISNTSLEESRISQFLNTDSEIKQNNGTDTLNDSRLPRSSFDANENSSSSVKNCDSNKQSNKLVDSILSDVVLNSSSNQVKKTDTVVESSDMLLSKSNSILYDSLTRPRDDSSKLVNNDSILESQRTEMKFVQKDNVGAVKMKEVPSSDAVVPEKPVECEVNKEELKNSNVGAIEVNSGVDNANIVLNVDENFQLIASDSDKLPDLADGTNYVLVSDETGAMQLVKENELRLVEGNDASGDAQYVVNLQGENFPNLELIEQGNGEQQLTYALQFDGENYTAIQFVQDDIAEDGKMTKLQEVNVDNSMVLKSAETGQTPAYVLPTVSTDLNSIGKELSDFLNIDYGSLTRTENNDS